MVTGKLETPLRRAMREKGVAVVQLAKDLNLGRPYVSDIVNGWATESTRHRWAPRIAVVLGVPVGELFPDLARTAGEEWEAGCDPAGTQGEADREAFDRAHWEEERNAEAPAENSQPVEDGQE